MLASKSMYQSEHLARAEVALVTNDAETDYMKQAIRYISNMSSTSLSLDFKVMSEENAMRALKQHEVIAVMLFPDDVINGILYGRNDPITVYFSEDDSLSAVFLSELTWSGARMLSAAQAGTYSAAELYTTLGAEAELGKAYNDIDILNFNYVLSRENLYITEETLPVFMTYIASAVILLLFFSTAAFAPALKKENTSFYDVLFSGKAYSCLYLLTRFLANWLVSALLLLLVYLPLARFADPPFDIQLRLIPECFADLFLICAVTAAFALFLHTLTGSAPVAILLQLLCSVLMLFASGGILPPAFLPSGLRALGQHLPTAILSEQLLLLLQGSRDILLLPLLGWIVLFFAAACITFLIRKGAKRL